MTAAEMEQKIKDLEAKGSRLYVEGKKTSEYFLAKVAIVVGVVMAALPGVTDALGIAAKIFPGAEWVKVAFVIVGAVTPLLASLAYTIARLRVKLAIADAIAPEPSVADAQAEIAK